MLAAQLRFQTASGKGFAACLVASGVHDSKVQRVFLKPRQNGVDLAPQNLTPTMRLAYITVPLSLLIAAAGAAMFYAAKANAPAVPTTSNEWKVLTGQPRHPVTPEMWHQADGAKGMDAPAFDLPDTNGNKITLADLTKDRPLFMYFVLQGCPCSLEAQPHYERLQEQFKGAVNFLAVTNAPEEDAKKWKTEFAVPFPVISQPKLELMHLYGVTRSVYCLLIGKDGKIIKMWPGYNATMLQQVNEEMATALDLPVKKFDPKFAPEIMTSGCEFPKKG
jgi:peroxiredoxin